MDQAYEPLLYRNAEGEIIEYLATDYERLGEQEVEFTLREGVQFHSGDEMTAEDVAYSINRTVVDDVGLVNPQQDGLSGIEGAVAVMYRRDPRGARHRDAIGSRRRTRPRGGALGARERGVRDGRVDAGRGVRDGL